MNNAPLAGDRVSLVIPHASPEVRYDVVIGSNIFASLPELASFASYSKVLIVVDEQVMSIVEPLAAPLLNDNCSLFPITCGEKNKDINSLEQLLTTFNAKQLDRRSLVVNVGGGMLGDISGFAASVYMRGVDFIQVPTTLLAQVDASVGGKVAINFAGVKNLIGAFQQPKLVLIDVSLLSTLPKRELFSGFAEIIKHALIFDGAFLKDLEAHNADALSNENLTEIIRRSCEIKAAVVQKDPHERNLRKILNCGHTIAHAIESLAATGQSPLLHGECVALGIVAETALARLRGHITAEDCRRIEKVLIQYHLPVRLNQKLSAELLIERMRHDKKNTSGEISFALLSGIGSCLPAITAGEKEILSALEAIYPA